MLGRNPAATCLAALLLLAHCKADGDGARCGDPESPITACTAGDACCPTGCDYDADTDCPMLGVGLAGTASGLVRGAPGDGVTVFRGIPYAAPPVGDLRWRAPSAPASWSGERDATVFGFACFQPTTPLIPGSRLPSAAEQSEDCLTLNAWTPAVSAGEGLPVMVWLHGGGWAFGAGWLPEYDGAALARQGSVVVVTVNYRLGVMGYLAHAALGAETANGASGDYGLMDQVAALAWVRNNVRELGGDPDNVTVFGESAGGGSVCHLLVSPLASGLFHRAIVQSAACVAQLRDLHAQSVKWPRSGEELGALVEQRLGCSGATPAETIACMRGATYAELAAAVPASTGTFDDDGEKFWPLVDGHALAEQPGASFNSGAFERVPLLAGHLDDEMGLHFASLVSLQSIDTVAEYEAAIQATFGAYWTVVRNAYPAASDALANATYARYLRDVTFVCPTRYTLRKVSAAMPGSVFRYHITRVHPSGRVVLPGTGAMGAYHASDLFYMFDDLDPYGRYTVPSAENQGFVVENADRQLASAMVAYWTRFARTGAPNGAPEPSWPAFDSALDAYLVLDSPPVASADLAPQCDVFDPFYAAQ